jgi:hypothetical protein
MSFPNNLVNKKKYKMNIGGLQMIHQINPKKSYNLEQMNKKTSYNMFLPQKNHSKDEDLMLNTLNTMNCLEEYPPRIVNTEAFDNFITIENNLSHNSSYSQNNYIVVENGPKKIKMKKLNLNKLSLDFELQEKQNNIAAQINQNMIKVKEEEAIHKAQNINKKQAMQDIIQKIRTNPQRIIKKLQAPEVKKSGYEERQELIKKYLSKSNSKKLNYQSFLKIKDEKNNPAILKIQNKNKIFNSMDLTQNQLKCSVPQINSIQNNIKTSYGSYSNLTSMLTKPENKTQEESLTRTLRKNKNNSHHFFPSQQQVRTINLFNREKIEKDKNVNIFLTINKINIVNDKKSSSRGKIIPIQKNKSFSIMRNSISDNKANNSNSRNKHQNQPQYTTLQSNNKCDSITQTYQTHQTLLTEIDFNKSLESLIKLTEPFSIQEKTNEIKPQFNATPNKLNFKAQNLTDNSNKIVSKTDLKIEKTKLPIFSKKNNKIIFKYPKN